MKRTLTSVLAGIIILASLIIIAPKQARADNTIGQVSWCDDYSSSGQTVQCHIQLHSGYNLVSMPFLTLSNKPSDLFANFVNVQHPGAKLLRLNSSGTGYNTYSGNGDGNIGNINTGDVFYIKVNEDCTYDFTGYDVRSNFGFIRLASGWNTFGSPISTNFDWSKAKVMTSAGKVYSLLEAANNHLIEQGISGWSNETNGYFSVNATGFSGDYNYLQPGLGYYVLAYQNVTLIFDNR